MKIIALAAAALAAAFAAPQIDDWGSTTDAVQDPEYEASRAICRRVKDREPPASDRPGAATARALQGCSSEALYYGIGMPADPVRARQCAFTEALEPHSGDAFSGRAMLMTIYANGKGAKRDLDVATHLACGLNAAPMEHKLRVEHLAAMKDKGAGEPEFGYCDHITSGFAGGQCAAHESQISAVKRDAKIAALTGGYTPAQKAAFATLRKAQAAFALAHADNEVDMTGTLRTAFHVQAQDALADQFLETLEALAAKRVPGASPAELRRRDAALNASYRRTQSALSREGIGTVSAKGVRDAQRAWLRYRDSFLAFARATYPQTQQASLAAWLTARRTQMLDLEN
jgi:hypothetical protein